jgi:AcrR family transcriptional regulator
MRDVPAELAQKLLGAVDGLGPSFDDVRMDDIAQVSGIPRATLYYYFAGKDDVLAFLLQAMLDDLRQALDVTSDGDVRTRLTRVVDSHLTHMAAHPAVAQVLVLNLGRLGKLAELATNAGDPSIDAYGRVLADAVANGELRSLDAEVTALSISGAVHTLGLRAVVSGAAPDTRRLAEQVVDVFWAGIRPDPAG